MIGSLVKKLFILIIPALLLSAAYVVLPHMGSLPQAWFEVIPYLPYTVIAVGMFLSLNFHRSRVFFILLNLAVMYWSCSTYLRNGLVDFDSRMIYLAISILLPFNILLFCYMRERGVISRGGRLRLAFLAGQAGLVAWFIRYKYDSVEHFFARKFVSSPLIDRLAVPQVALAVICVAFLLIMIRIIARQTPIESGFLGTLAAVAFVCHRQGSPDVSLAFVTGAGLILTLTILQDTYNMAFRDDLTGLPSRRALNEQLAGLGRRYVIAMVDVDHFKRFNDTYGHDVGDQVLRMVASRIMEVKGGGRSYRYGGEEFTILFHRRKIVDALPHLEALRKEIAGYRLCIRGTDRPKQAKDGKKNRSNSQGDTAVSVTVSIGVAESEEGHTPAEILRNADKALYRAKQKGRNQTSK